MNHTNFYFVLTIIFITFIGCSPSMKRDLPVEYVEGIVTMDGVPLDNASIQFIPKTGNQGEAAGGYSDVKGKYTLSSMNGDIGNSMPTT